MVQSPLVQIIGAIGREDFAAVTADALCGFMGFDLSAVIVHHRKVQPDVLFHNFDIVGCRLGIENYVRFTRRINPMLARAPAVGVCRARDYATSLVQVSDGIDAYLVQTAQEELGFLTVGWPERLEEIGLYFEARGELVEIGLYRERRRCMAPASKLRALQVLRGPIAAAFEKHSLLQREEPRVWAGAASCLTPREQEICELLITGCSSEAIALRLDISRYTVKDHRKQIFRKLGVGSLAELFTLACRPNQSPPWRDSRHV